MSWLTFSRLSLLNLLLESFLFVLVQWNCNIIQTSHLDEILHGQQTLFLSLWVTLKILPVIPILSNLLVCPKQRFRTGYICYTMLLLLHSIEINLIFVLSTLISKQYGFSHDILYVNLAVDQTLLYTHATRVVVYLCSRVGVGPVRPLPLPKLTLSNWE